MYKQMCCDALISIAALWPKIISKSFFLFFYHLVNPIDIKDLLQQGGLAKMAAANSTH